METDKDDKIGKYIPSKIIVYLLSKDDTRLKNFILHINEDKGNYLMSQFLKDFGNEVLKLGIPVIKNFGQLVSKVDGLTKKLLHQKIMADIDSYEYTIKIDGNRSLLVLDGNNIKVI